MKRFMACLLCLLLCTSALAVAPDWAGNWVEIVELDMNPPSYLARRTGAWSMLDAQGRVVYDDALDAVGPFVNGVSIVRKGGLYGYLRKDGTLLVEPKYSDAGNFFEDRARVEKDGKKGFIDLEGREIIPLEYDYANDFKHGYAVVGRKGQELIGDSSSVEYERLWGLIDPQGEVLLPLKFKNLELQADGSVLAESKEGLRYSFVIQDGVPVQTDSQQDWTLKWVELRKLECDPLRYLAWNGTEWWLLDGDGGVLRENVARDVYPFVEGAALVEKDEKFGYIDARGEWIVDPAEGFDRAYDFVGEYAPVMNWGDPLSPEERLSGANEYESLWGAIDREGRLVLPLEYEHVEVMPDGSLRVLLNGAEKILTLRNGAWEEIVQVPSSFNLDAYMPNVGEQVAKLDGEVQMEWSWSADAPLPRLDGATALFPVYAAVVEALYPAETRYSDGEDALVTCTKTNRAYERLISGETDLIFCAQPSEKQIEMAAAQGVEFELTPFGKEAFVFIVNQENPLDAITVDQIRQIYSGQITDWSALGIADLGEIIAYQRPENSGSQTALQDLMGDVALMTPPQERSFDFMDEIINNIEYRNLPGAIGYSFRFFCTEMMNSGVKLLAIDGVEPSIENIRNGSYPLTSTLYCVTRKGETNPNVQALVDWMRSAQGQGLVEKSGYVAW